MRKLCLLLTAGLVLSSGAASHADQKAGRGDEKRRPQTRANVAPDGDSHLLEIGHGTKIRSVIQTPADIKVVSYNIRWRAGEDLRKLAQLLKYDREIGGASIMGLQEVDRHKARTRHQNTVKFLADELGMHYAWVAPPAVKSDKEEETGVALLSFYPLRDVRRIVLPHEGPGLRRRVAVGATITIGQTSVRIYSVHSETRMPIAKKMEQMKTALDDLAHYPKDMPAIVVGDLNTWEQEAMAKTYELFASRSFHTPFDDQPTLSRKFLFISVDLKLDWIWVRNLESREFGVDREIRLSDHWPLWLVVRMEKSKT
ncbi:MAG: endonuclease/exonuclease/phosphatase family protein [Pyrinomonadaceae bacterium]